MFVLGIMDTSDEAVEVPIEAAQEYITTALGIAPLHISDLSMWWLFNTLSLVYNIFTDNLCELVETVVDKIHTMARLILRLSFVCVV